jgi:hypothetical protein
MISYFQYPRGRNFSIGPFGIRFIGFQLLDDLLAGHVLLFDISSSRVSRTTVIHLSFELRFLFFRVSVGLAARLRPLPGNPA